MGTSPGSVLRNEIQIARFLFDTTSDVACTKIVPRDQRAPRSHDDECTCRGESVEVILHVDGMDWHWKSAVCLRCWVVTGDRMPLPMETGAFTSTPELRIEGFPKGGER